MAKKKSKDRKTLQKQDRLTVSQMAQYARDVQELVETYRGRYVGVNVPKWYRRF